jgi:hypothetical protein
MNPFTIPGQYRICVQDHLLQDWSERLASIYVTKGNYKFRKATLLNGKFLRSVISGRDFEEPLRQASDDISWLITRTNKGGGQSR